MPITAALLAALVGLSLGLLGGGGSILTVPIFVYILGYAPKPAIAMSLPVVGITSLVAALNHHRAGNVDWRTAALFGAFTMAGAFLGAKLSVLVSGTIQLILLAIVMLAAATSMLLRARRAAKAHASTLPTTPTTIHPDTQHTRPRWLIAIVALGVGILTGIVGIGGGFLIVPALVVLANVPVHRAVGTSLLVITITTAAGYAGYIGQFTIPWPFLAAFSAITVTASLVGAMLSRRISSAALSRAFAVFLMVIGTLMLYQNIAKGASH